MRPVNPSAQKDNRNLKTGSFPNAVQGSNQADDNPVEPPGHEVEVGEREGDFPPDIKMNQIDDEPQADSNNNQRSPASGPAPDRDAEFNKGVNNQNH